MRKLLLIASLASVVSLRATTVPDSPDRPVLMVGSIAIEQPDAGPFTDYAVLVDVGEPFVLRAVPAIPINQVQVQTLRRLSEHPRVQAKITGCLTVHRQTAVLIVEHIEEAR